VTTVSDLVLDVVRKRIVRIAPGGERTDLTLLRR
jgi:hypothetical protein